MLYGILLALAVVVDLVLVVMIFSSILPFRKQPIKKLPKVSVIIAAKDEPLLARTLKGLKKVRSPKIEIIVAASGKETVRIARKFTRKVIIDRGLGKGVALNMAVKKASSDMLYFLDADSLVEADTIAKVCSALYEHDAATGFNIPSGGSSLVSFVSRLYVAMLNKVQYGLYRLIGKTYVGGRNFAVRKSTLRKIGFFRNVLTEDLEFSFRMFEAGKKIGFVDARCSETTPDSMHSYFRQQQRWNAGAGTVLKEWEKKMHHHDIAIMSFLVVIAFMPVLSLVFLALAFAYGEAVFLSVFILAFIFCLSSLLILETRDAVFLPATFMAMIVMNSATLAYAALRKPDAWFKTPKD